MYASDGSPMRIAFMGGGWVDFDVRSDSRIEGLVNNFNQTISFVYEYSPDKTADRLIEINHYSGLIATFEYNDSNMISAISWNDGSRREFVYEDDRFNWALTGVIDENNSRFSTFAYDEAGRAISTEHANSAFRFQVSYTNAPRRLISENHDIGKGVILRDFGWTRPDSISISRPDGSSSQLNAELVLGVPSFNSQSQPAGSGCAASTSYRTYDVNANVASADDFNGNRSCYVHDLSRNLETGRVEGLATSAVCSAVTGLGSSLPAGSRKTSTQWHPDWRLESKKAEPNRITTYVYNGQPDPLNGNAIASCAPTSALLPDGKPIAVLCKQVEQATMDASGTLGFAAALDSSAAPRIQSWTYNQFGQILTHDGPRTDVSDVTTYTYYSATTANYTKGDLQSMTNPLGKTTQYTQYNPHGQLLQSTDPNGVVTSHTYDLRQRLLSTTVAGLTTSFTYDAAGQLTRVTQPDASYVGYVYDAAHRQTAVFDNLGNRIEYTLDNAGNRTAEHVKDPAGTLRRQRTWSIDALGRVQQMTGGE